MANSAGVGHLCPRGKETLAFAEGRGNEDVTRFPLKFTDPGQGPRRGWNMVESGAASKPCVANAGGGGRSRNPGRAPPRGGCGAVGDAAEVPE